MQVLTFDFNVRMCAAKEAELTELHDKRTNLALQAVDHFPLNVLVGGQVPSHQTPGRLRDVVVAATVDRRRLQQRSLGCKQKPWTRREGLNKLT